ncbi:cell growth-regulating nucleolar protein [Diachasma alloeum]|uniref:cell growth-regulating nucleolar protein n=1 Tax=Diachasma alloeum TaxID=454923 RepID=UPI00073817D3|nr:cell growth-regulating nucleolar protein [Diachasma alloeum]
MVVFTCNNCGDSLQKPKVAKHYQFQCRNGVSLTCVDCFKDFIGDEYVAHTKCITEAERYGGKDYKAKPSANKGERKQQEWINVVQNVLTNSTNLSREERSFLQSISRHQNIPRKKAKFLNFVKNAVGYRLNMSVVDSCWGKMESAFKEATESKPEAPKAAEKTEEIVPEKADHQETHVVENENNENICRENGDSSTGKENTSENGNDGLANGKKKRKAKKRQLEGEDCSEGQNGEPSPKKRTSDAAPAPEEPPAASETAKFSWKSSILEILGDKDDISLKKLRKKVVERYLSHVGDAVTREKVISRFEKKLKKISELQSVDDRVKRV